MPEECGSKRDSGQQKNGPVITAVTSEGGREKRYELCSWNEMKTSAHLHRDLGHDSPFWTSLYLPMPLSNLLSYLEVLEEKNYPSSCGRKPWKRAELIHFLLSNHSTGHPSPFNFITIPDSSHHTQLLLQAMFYIMEHGWSLQASKLLLYSKTKTIKRKSQFQDKQRNGFACPCQNP